MQKVEGSSPFIRFSEACVTAGSSITRHSHTGRPTRGVSTPASILLLWDGLPGGPRRVTICVMTSLRTPLCRDLGIDHPVFSVGFGMGAGPELVAAVSDAGGLGVIGGDGRSRELLVRASNGRGS